jgi:cell division septation protein DedD
VFWNGFRQRPPGLDQPVVFAGADTTALDSAARDSLARDTARAATPDAIPPAPPPPPAPGFIVSFAAVLSEARALTMAESISVGGARARVVQTQRGDATLHRVVLGPYPTRAAAEAAGRASRRQFWVYQETP